MENMIQIYHSAFRIAFILTIVFFIISLFLFFKFDIRNIFAVRSGRDQKKAIQRMKERNARTGSLQGRTDNFREKYRNSTEMLQTPPIVEAAGDNDYEKTDVLMKKNDQKQFSQTFIVDKQILWVHTNERL